MRMNLRGLLLASALVALLVAAGCQESLADRCYLSADCPGGLVCSNDDQRAHQGFCVAPPEEEPEAEDTPDAGTPDDMDADGTAADEDGGQDAG